MGSRLHRFERPAPEVEPKLAHVTGRSFGSLREARSPLATDLPGGDDEEGGYGEARPAQPPVLTGEGARQLSALMDNMVGEFQGMVRA